MALALEQLRAIAPKCASPERWIEPLSDAMARFDISTPHRMAAFLAQLAHESADFSKLVENLNYSAKRLMQVWPKRFPTIAKAKQFAHNAEKLANYVYAKRLGNGDEASGDGWRFRGRGLIQLTGRANYRSIGDATGLPLESNPELLLQPAASATAAAHFWRSCGLNELADDHNDDNDDEDFVMICVRINGGKIGLKERRAHWARARQALGISSRQ